MRRSYSLALTLSLSLRCGESWTWDEPPVNGDPLHRSGHTVSTYERGIIACGGQGLTAGSFTTGCVQINPFSDWTVSSVIAPGASLGRVFGAAALSGVTADGNRYLVLWGGVLNNNATIATDCEVFGVSSWKKSPLTCVGDDVPDGRWGHSGVVQGNTLFVFGGALLEGDTPTTDAPTDVGALDLYLTMSSLKWSKPTVAPGPVPEGRHLHAATIGAVASGTRAGLALMFIQGGYSFEKGTTLTDLWQLTIPIASTTTPPAGAFVWTRRAENPASGAPPLYGHSIVLVGSTLIAYGGQVPTRPGGSDLLIRSLTLDVNPSDAGSAWSSPAINEGMPLGFPFAAGVVLLDTNGDGDDEIAVIGGRNPVTNLSVSKVAVLGEINFSYAPLLKELPLILGGAAIATFLLVVLGFFAWRNRANRYINADEDLGRDPLLDGPASYGGFKADESLRKGGGGGYSTFGGGGGGGGGVIELSGGMGGEEEDGEEEEEGVSSPLPSTPLPASLAAARSASAASAPRSTRSTGSRRSRVEVGERLLF